MAVNSTSRVSSSRVVDSATGAGPSPTPALDVHSHSMPLPLLARLADRGLADVSGVAQGIVRLDTRVSGVGPNAPLPLAKSQYDVTTRLSEMDDVGVQVHVVSLPPFLFCTPRTTRPSRPRSSPRATTSSRSTSREQPTGCSVLAPSRSAGRAPRRRPAALSMIWGCPESRSEVKAGARISIIR